MNIEIRQRFRPYSHMPGATALVPGTLWVVRATPSCLRIEDLSGVVHHEMALGIAIGPKRGFTLQQDLEKQLVFVFGQADKGFYRLQIRPLPEGIELKQGDQCSVVPLGGPRGVKARERLSLGSHKAQDWDLVRRRWDLREILPQIFHLGQQTPAQIDCSEQSLEALCMEIFPPQIPSASLLCKGAKMIRNVFVQERGDELLLLPSSPILFDSGRLVGVEWGNIGRVDFEWTKRQMRRLVLRVQVGGVRTFFFPKEVKEFRLRSNCQEERCNNGQPLVLAAGTTYLLDHFQK